MDRSPEASRFQAAVAMADTGVRIMRQNLRRRHPDDSDAEIDERLRRWLRDRPMGPPGHVRQLPLR